MFVMLCVFYARLNVTKYQIYQFFMSTKNLHIKSFTLISSCLLYVKVKIYTSSLLHCYQLTIFNLKYIVVHQSKQRYCSVSVENIFMPSSPSFTNQEGLVCSFLLLCLMHMYWRENLRENNSGGRKK